MESVAYELPFPKVSGSVDWDAGETLGNARKDEEAQK